MQKLLTAVLVVMISVAPAHAREQSSNSPGFSTSGDSASSCLQRWSCRRASRQEVPRAVQGTQIIISIDRHLLPLLLQFGIEVARSMRYRNILEKPLKSFSAALCNRARSDAIYAL